MSKRCSTVVRVSLSAAVVAWCFTLVRVARTCSVPGAVNQASKRRNIRYTFAITAVTQAAEGAKVLDRPTDLDLSGVVKAINFGETANQAIGGVIFRAAPANSTVDGVKWSILG